MPSRVETLTYVVPLVETNFVRLTDQETPRIRQEQALNGKLVIDSIKPQLVTEINVAGSPWGVVAPLSPYNSDPESLHVMVVEMSNRYLPDPHRIPVHEGIALMKLLGGIAEFLERRPDSKSIHLGYNWSPRAYGTAEEKGGYQTLTTKLHFQAWNYTPKCFNQHIPVESLADGTRWAIMGDKYKRFAAEQFCKPILIQEGSEFLDTPSIEVDQRGVMAPLLTSLRDTISSPNFFPFLRNVDAWIDQVACDLTNATTNVNTNEADKMIGYAFEHGTDGILPTLRQDPELLPMDVRRRNISSLSGRGYSERSLRALQLLNTRLKERGETEESAWIRKGFGYALVLSEDRNRQPYLRISPGIFVGDRGGVVEANGIALKRKEEAEASPEEVQKRRTVLVDLAHRISA